MIFGLNTGAELVAPCSYIVFCCSSFVVVHFQHIIKSYLKTRHNVVVSYSPYTDDNDKDADVFNNYLVNDLCCHTFNVPVSLTGIVQHMNHSG